MCSRKCKSIAITNQLFSSMFKLLFEKIKFKLYYDTTIRTHLDVYRKKKNETAVGYELL